MRVILWLRRTDILKTQFLQDIHGDTPRRLLEQTKSDVENSKYSRLVTTFTAPGRIVDLCFDIMQIHRVLRDTSNWIRRDAIVISYCVQNVFSEQQIVIIAVYRKRSRARRVRRGVSRTYQCVREPYSVVVLYGNRIVTIAIEILIVSSTGKF